MRKILVTICTLICFVTNAQQKNTLLDQSFWKNSPDVAAVKAEIAKGNSATAFNPMTFDAATMAINSDAPAETIKFLIEQPGNGVDKITHDGRLYLHWAASKGNVEIVNYLLEKGSDVNLEDSHATTPVTFAANNGQNNTAVYDAFFKAGVNPKQKYRDGANLLLIAIPNDKDLALSNYFVSKGMSLNDTDANGNTAFNYAAKSGDVALLKSLLAKGVKYNEGALTMAAQGTRRSVATIDVYKYLVDDLKIKPGITNKEGETVLHQVVRKPKQSEIINYFILKGTDINIADNGGNTALMNAAGGRDTEALELLLSKVKNINAVNLKGESALTVAVNSGSAEAVSLLINKGADVNVRDKDGNSLAFYVVQSYRAPRQGAPANDDFSNKIKLLQDKGLNFAAPQKDGNTLYHVAIIKNELDLVKKLATLKVDVNAKNKEGITALHKAAMVSKDDATLKYLLSIGAKKDAKTEFDETAYNLAKENEFISRNNISIDFLK